MKGLYSPFREVIVPDGRLIYTSGQLPKKGDVMVGDWDGTTVDIKAQVTQALENLKAVLESAGVGLNEVPALNIFFDPLESLGSRDYVYALINEAYGEFFAPYDFPAPCRLCVVGAPPVIGAFVEIKAEVIFQRGFKRN